VKPFTLRRSGDRFLIGRELPGGAFAVEAEAFTLSLAREAQRALTKESRLAAGAERLERILLGQRPPPQKG